MSSPSAPPSTATSSSLSKADSITNMDFLHNSQGQGHHRASSGSSSTTNTSMGQGTTTSAIQSSQEPAASSRGSATPTPGASSPTSSNSTATGNGAKDGSNKSVGTPGSGSEQGRNSSKRAAQNRAAQRAFRQRKDLYVRELERKAELLSAAETQLITLTARNRELEAMLTYQHQQPPPNHTSTSSSPLPSPLPQQDGYVSGLMGARGEREWDRERERERERDWSFRERFESGNAQYDHFHSSSAPSMRPAIGRHSSAQHLRQAYNAASPSFANGTSIKHLSLNSKLSSAYNHHQRPDSDHEIEGQLRRPLHRHPSESSLNLSRTSSFVPPPAAEIKEDDYVGGSWTHGFRGGPAAADPRGEMLTASPSSGYKSPMSGPHEPPAYYPSSPLSPTNERVPAYASGHNPRSTSGANSGSMSSPTSGQHGDGAYNTHPPSHPPSHPSSSSYDPNKKRPSDSTVSWSGSEPYRGPQEGVHHPYHSVKKQASWSSLSDQRRLHAVKKQPSWGSIAEHRNQWRTRTESPEFGGSAPALPRIPSQFSTQQQQPSQPQGSPPTSLQHRSGASQQQQQHGEYPTSSPIPFAYSPTAHTRQPSDYHNPPRHPPTPHDANGPSDMEIVHEGGHGSYNNYNRPGEYEADSYESERRSDLQHHAQQSPHMGSP